MNNGVLEFALGLQTNQFLERIGFAGEKLLGFIGLAEGVGGAFDRVWEQIEKGAQLKDLSARTGESVANLYKLQEAFKAVGLGADEVSPMILRAERSLSGVSETGESTLRYFTALGLNLQQLRALDGATQIQKIAESLSHVDRNQASGAAAQLFGREGAGNILQIARAMQEFSESFEGASKGAAGFDRSAAAFKAIEHSATTIKSQIGLLWAGIAEGSAPAIKSIENALKKIDFEGIGEKFGMVLEAFTAAFSDGSVTSLIAESITAGFRAAIEVLPAIMEQMSEVMFRSLRDAGSSLFVWMAKWNADHRISGRDPDGRPIYTRDQKAWDIADAAGRADKQANAGGDMAVDKLISQDMAAALQRAGAGLRPLLDHFKDLALRFQSTDGGDIFSGTKAPSLTNAAMKAEPYNKEFTSLEKMGFVMSGLGNPMIDHARQTAQNTGKMVSLLERAFTRADNYGYDMTHLPA